MSWQKYLKSMWIWAVVISQVAAISPGLPSRLLAQSFPMKISLQFPPTSDRGAPKTTTGGGTRGNSCTETGKEAEEIPLTPLMPIDREGRTTNLGKTATAHPVLYWYVPPNTAEFGEFLVIDDKGKEVYLGTFELPSTDGIIKLRIPENVVLEPDRDYSWTLSLVCDPLDRGRDRFVEGVVRHLSLKLDLAGKTPLEQAKIYAQQEIWHDTLDLVARLYTDSSAEWEELLESVELEKIAKKPLLKCCTAKPTPF